MMCLAQTVLGTSVVWVALRRVLSENMPIRDDVYPNHFGKAMEMEMEHSIGEHENGSADLVFRVEVS